MEVIALYVIAGTLGAMLFFAIGVAPTVFQALPAEQAGLFLRKLFPRYYLSLIIGSTAGGLLWLGTQPLASGVCLLIAVSTLWIRQWLVPQINALRDRELSGDVSAGEEFARLHRLSVTINLLQLLALLGMLIMA
ncbi:MAG: hypothetical protein CBC82_10415 [Cellvibrionales bacterium TMED122]|nr:MAG: hypothetical protein CBC82_10415 [Cellvibrionales bacterium TMED122]